MSIKISPQDRMKIEMMIANPIGNNLSLGFRNNFPEVYPRFNFHLANRIYQQQCHVHNGSMQLPKERLEEPISVAWERFNDGIHTDDTRRTYTLGLKAFLDYYGINHLDLIQMDTETRQRMLEKYVKYHNSLVITKNTKKTYLAGIFKFLDMNRCEYFKKPITAMLKDNHNDEVGGNSTYTNEHILKMLNSTVIYRTRVSLLAYASTGMRVNALCDPVLRMKHLFEIEDCYALRIMDYSQSGYAESSKYGMWVYLTPETRNVMDEYLNWRRSNGENLEDPETPLFASFSIHHNAMTRPEIYRMFQDLQKKADIEKIKIGYTRLGRTNIPLMHGFRKRYFSILVKNGLESHVIDKLMGHRGSLGQKYYRPSMSELFEEFKKVIPDLTIGEGEKYKIQLESKTKELAELNQVRELNNELLSKNQKLERALLDKILEEN